jgi:hypothetical protein
MKFVLVVIFLVLLFGGGGSRLRALFGAAKQAPKTFRDARAKDADPVGHAREVKGRTIDDERA